eukprot:Phypoly_transcript_06432.p1 GENE.Phypoly_transcript_06432~~Phypoly_transcript_06432.p1  ORF type:complete len:244 (+),score=45.69 Phypoly_transcript_06432:756-1487(+)
MAKEVMQYECSMQGSFLDETLVPVLDRLRGLCSSESPLHYREIVYRPPNVPGLPPPSSASSEVMRVRCHYPPPENKQSPENKWTLRNYNAMSNDKRAATVKNVVEVEVSNNVCSFLEYMGYKHDFEFFMKGYKFTSQRILTITVTQIKKSDKGHQDPTDIFGKVWLVDVSCIASDEQLAHACEQIQAFSEHLLPYVDIAKIDKTALDKTAQPMAPNQANFANFSSPTSPRGFPGLKKENIKRR